MFISAVSSNINMCGRPTAKDVHRPLKFWADNRNLSPNYSNEMKVFFTNTFYNCRKGIGRHSLEGYSDVVKLFDTKNIISLNGESVVFMLNDGNVLKLSVDKYGDYIPDFHAPELQRGSIKTPKLYKIFNYLKDEYTDTFYYVIQKKGDRNTTKEDQTALIKKVKEAGYDVCDIKPGQFAYFDINGKKEIRFVDLGCVVPKGQGGW